jgi:hypothetical protein
MNRFDYPQLCPKCQGYKTMPYSWNSTVQPRMCNCPKPTSLAWECPRCKKVNAPWKGSCDCTPTPFSNPISVVGPFNIGPGPLLNKNFTDK